MLPHRHIVASRSPPATDPDPDRKSRLHLHLQMSPTILLAMRRRCPMHRARGTHRPARQKTSASCRRGRQKILSACRRLAHRIVLVDPPRRLSSTRRNPRFTIEFLPLQIPFARLGEASMRPRRDMRPVPPHNPSPSSLLRRIPSSLPAGLDSTSSPVWLRRRCRTGFRTPTLRQRSSMPLLGGTGPSTSLPRSSTLPRRTVSAVLPHQE